MPDSQVTVTLALRDLFSGPAAAAGRAFGVLHTGLSKLASVANGVLSNRFVQMAAGIASVATAMKALDAGRESANAEAALKAALRNRVELYALFAAQAKEIQRKTIYEDDAIIKMQAQMLNMQVPLEKLQKTTDAAVQLAAALDMPVEAAGNQLAITFGGTIPRELGKALPELKHLTDESLAAGAAVEMVSTRFAGFAEKLAMTPYSRATQAANLMGDELERIGDNLVRVQTASYQMLGRVYAAMNAVLSSSGGQKLLDTIIGAIDWIGVKLEWLVKAVGTNGPFWAAFSNFVVKGFLWLELRLASFYAYYLFDLPYAWLEKLIDRVMGRLIVVASDFLLGNVVALFNRLPKPLKDLIGGEAVADIAAGLLLANAAGKSLIERGSQPTNELAGVSYAVRNQAIGDYFWKEENGRATGVLGVYIQSLRDAMGAIETQAKLNAERERIEVDKLRQQLGESWLSRWMTQGGGAAVKFYEAAWKAGKDAFEKAEKAIAANEKFMKLRSSMQSDMLKAQGFSGQAMVVDFWEARRQRLLAASATGNPLLIDYANRTSDAERAGLGRKITDAEIATLSQAQGDYNTQLQTTKALTEQGLITHEEANRRMRQATQDLGKEISRIAQDNAGLIRDGILSEDDVRMIQERMELIRRESAEAAFQQEHGFRSTAKAARDAADTMKDSMRSGMSDMLFDVVKGTKTMAEAFQAFGQRILDTMLRIVTDRIAEMFIGMLFGMFSGGMGGAAAGGAAKGGGGLFGIKFAEGGVVPGTGTGDTVPAMLTPGEVVFPVKAVSMYGKPNLLGMIQAATGRPALGGPYRYADGGVVQGGGSGGAQTLQVIAHVPPNEINLERQLNGGKSAVVNFFRNNRGSLRQALGV